MDDAPLTIFDIGERSRAVTAQYANFSLATVNDHVIKVSVMAQPYHWHYHPNSDETFMVIEGVLLIDLEMETIELFPGQLLAIPKNIIHRTRPQGERSVNLTKSKRYRSRGKCGAVQLYYRVGHPNDRLLNKGSSACL